MKKVRNYRVLRPVARLLAGVFFLLWQAPPANAFRAPYRYRGPKQILNAEDRTLIARKDQQAKEAAERVDVRPLNDAELSRRGRGLRNPNFSGALPWRRTFRGVDCATGNLFQSSTDIQVQGARGAGLAFQRTYNSNDGREGPFGVGWTHAYDIRMQETADLEADTSWTSSDPDKANEVPRTDFFGGKHFYHRDADGLYSPPAYLYDELSSEYTNSLVSGPPVSADDSDKGMDGTVKHYTRIGNDRVCDSITDRHGNQTTLTYGSTVTIGGVSHGLLTRVTDPSGRYLDITWTNVGTTMSPAWRITAVQGPYDTTTSSYVYTVTYEYNSDHNLWKVHQDPSGLNRTTTYTYTTYTSGTSTESGLLASVADPLSHTVSYTYGTHSLLGTVAVTSVAEPSTGGSLTWNFTWGVDAPAALLCNVSEDGTKGQHYIAVGFDSQLRLMMYGIIGVGEYVFYKQYDTDNNVIAEDDANGGYCPLIPTSGTPGLYEEVFPAVTQMTYGPHGNVLTQYVWDSGTSTASSTTTTTYYDASKYFQKASVTDPNGHTTSMDYYDDQDTDVGKRGELIYVRDARYGTTGKQFTYTYNSYGQKTSETNLNDVETDYTYGDTWGNLTQTVQDPGTGHLNRTTSMSYDVAGRVISSTDPMSQTSTFTYNAVGQPYQATLPSETVTYTYDSNGRTASVQDGRGTTTLAYETGNDRVSSVTDPVTGAISYTYLPSGERDTMTLPGSGTWTYGYLSTWQMLSKDDPNTLAFQVYKITDDQGREVRYSITTHGEVREAWTNLTFSSGALQSYQKARYTYDNPTHGTHHWLQTVANTWNHVGMGGWLSSTLVQNDYTYDDAGNRLTNEVSDSSGPIRTETYGYDALNRLTSVDYGDGETQSYTFDPMGNRTSKSDTTTSTITESYTYNNANMLLTRGSNSYTNDADGNTLTGGGRTNTWDGENRLSQCVYGGVTTTHTYSATGLRHRTVNGTNTTDFILDGDKVLRTLLNSSVDKTYLHGPRGPEYERTGSGNPVWYLYDGLGSVLGTVDSSGAILNTRKYDVYGAVRASTGGSGPKHKFVGSLGHPSEDETGLLYMRARYMDPVVGTFISEDPARNGRNWYSYCHGNPIQNFDRDGRTTVNETTQTAAINEVLGGIADEGPLAALNFVQKTISMLQSAINLTAGVLEAGALDGTLSAAEIAQMEETIALMQGTMHWASTEGVQIAMLFMEAA